MKKVILSLLLMGGLSCFAQVSDEFELNKVTPSSPETAALAKFIDMPVNYNNGLPNIEVPLYTIQTKSGLSIPIKLSYHASGIKVNEQASQVGLGWKLTTGGMISREVQGFPDEIVGRKYPNHHPDLNTALSSFNLVHTLQDEFCADTASDVQILSYAYATDVTEIDNLKQFDALPDIFYYETPTSSGKFVYDSQWNIHTIPYDPISITKNIGDADFTVKDLGGNTFVFNIGSQYTQIPGVSQFNFFLEQAKLNTVTTSLNEVITYHYSNETYTYKNPTPVNDYTKISGGCGPIADNPQLIQTQFVNKRLNQIDFTDGKVQFFYSDDATYAIGGDTVRKDLPGGSALRRVVVYDKQNNIVKDYELSYSYFEATGGLTTDPDKYRLKLDRITEKGQKPYDFTYYGNGSIPHRFSTQQDYWGYYGGTGGLLPAMQFEDIVLSGSDRSVNETLIKTGTLEKITYPTKGSTTFYYNENEYKSDQVETSYTTHSTSIFNTLGTHSFALPTDSNNTRKIIFQNGCGNVGGGIQQDYCSFTIRNQGNQVVAQENTGGTYTLNSGNDGDNYTVTLEGNLGQSCNCSINIVGVEETTQTVHKKTQLSGLRLDRMVFDPLVGNGMTTTYDYTKPGTVDEISKTSMIPQFYYIKKSLSSNLLTGVINNCSYIARSGSPVITQNSGYDFVKEIRSGNGRSEYTFSSSVSSTNSTPLYHPYPGSLTGGKLLKKEVYSENDKLLVKEENTYAIDYSTNQQSSDYRTSFPNALTVGLSFNQIGSWQNQCGGAYVSFNYIDYDVFNVNSGWVKNTQSKNTTYHYNASNALYGSAVTTTDYFYDNATHAQVSKTEVTTNDNKKLRTITSYPDDVLTATTLTGDALTTTEYQAVEQLKKGNTHRIATPIQTESYEVASDGTATLLATRRNLFKQENGLIFPGIVQSALANDALEDRVVYHRYDSYGNPLEVSKTEGTHISYIWGYDKTMPIAKIENATYTELKTALNVTDAQYAALNENNMAQINALRDSLPKAMVSTYTYQPLVGMLSSTDARGYTTTYEYDTLNRLKYVKDADGNILTANEYNYKQ